MSLEKLWLVQAGILLSSKRDREAALERGWGEGVSAPGNLGRLIEAILKGEPDRVLPILKWLGCRDGEEGTIRGKIMDTLDNSSKVQGLASLTKEMEALCRVMTADEAVQRLSSRLARYGCPPPKPKSSISTETKSPSASTT